MTGQAKVVNATKLELMRVALPGIENQHKIVSCMKKFVTKVSFLNTPQLKKEHRLNALLPSILDKVFKGEL